MTIIHEYKRHVTVELTLLARKHVLTLIYCINFAMPTALNYLESSILINHP